jgi:Na+-driven multidrug efflux pump
MRHQSLHSSREVVLGAFTKELQEDDGGMSTPEAAWAWRTDKIMSMLRFMAPAMILPLADPLMSIIDTICIGKVRTLTRPSAA